MIKETVSAREAERFYDRLGGLYDLAERYEGRAKARALALLEPSPGQTVLEVGAGTGKILARLRAAVAPTGQAIGFDLSPVMIALACDRTGAPVCRGDVRHLPFAEGSVDRLFCSYVLDLIPTRDLPGVLSEFHRVLKPGGRLVVVTLTEGVDVPSRAIVGLWKLVYSVSPVVCGGCRPLQMSDFALGANLVVRAREVVVQLGIPSEVLAAER